MGKSEKTIEREVVSRLTTDGKVLGWGALIVWTTSTIIGALAFFYLPVIIFFPIAMISVGPVWLVTLALSITGLISGAIVGSIVGLAQRLVLRRRVSWATYWVRSTSVGWGIGGAIILALFYIFSELLDNNLSIIYGIAWVVGFTGIGLGQWLLLRSWIQRTSWWWVVITALGWLTGLIIGVIILGLVLDATVEEIMAQTISAIFSSSSNAGFLGFGLPPSFWVLTGGTAGIITGVSLNVLVAQSNKNKVNPPAPDEI